MAQGLGAAIFEKTYEEKMAFEAKNLKKVSDFFFTYNSDDLEEDVANDYYFSEGSEYCGGMLNYGDVILCNLSKIGEPRNIHFRKVITNDPGYVATVRIKM